MPEDEPIDPPVAAGENPIDELEDKTGIIDSSGDGTKRTDDDKKTFKVDDAKKEISSILPKTATNLFNYILIGSVLIGLGATLYFMMVRRKNWIRK